MKLDNIVIGLNGWGQIVLHCTDCKETLDHNVEHGTSVEKLLIKSAKHECNPEHLEFIQKLTAQEASPYRVTTPQTDANLIPPP